MLGGLGVAQPKRLLAVAGLQQCLPNDLSNRLAQPRHALPEDLVDEGEGVLVEAGGAEGRHELDGVEVGVTKDDVLVAGVGQPERPPQPDEELEREP